MTSNLCEVVIKTLKSNGIKSERFFDFDSGCGNGSIATNVLYQVKAQDTKGLDIDADALKHIPKTIITIPFNLGAV